MPLLLPCCDFILNLSVCVLMSVDVELVEFDCVEPFVVVVDFFFESLTTITLSTHTYTYIRYIVATSICGMYFVFWIWYMMA